MKRDFALPRKLWAMVAAATLVLGMTGFIATSQAAVGNPYLIDGTVPDAGTTEFHDPNGNAQELGPINGNSTKLGSIHTAAVPMLGAANPNGQTDLNTIWLGSEVDDADDVWLYLGSRSATPTGVAGSSSTSSCSRRRRRAATTPCPRLTSSRAATRSPTGSPATSFWCGTSRATPSTSSCAPGATPMPTATGSGTARWPSRFVLSAGTALANNDDAFAATGANGFRGEAAVNLSETIFELTPDECITIGNVIPGTITGNSDTADYKDVVLADVTDQVSISSCGLLTVTKEVTALEDSTDLFDFTVSREGGGVLDEASNTFLTYDDELAIGIPWESPEGLFAGSDYTLTEDDLSAAWTLESIFCTTGDGEPVEVTDGGAFSIERSVTTECVITNSPSQGTLIVVKEVVNDNGGSLFPGDFSFSVDGAEATSSSPTRRVVWWPPALRRWTRARMR